jgi:hypothetical protein
MVEYTIAAIPTIYKGVKYRSRLEARWAAFFDLLGFEFEYEPFDLGPWSPDFLLKKGDGSIPDILVEVKPITDFDVETSEKITKAYLQQDREVWFPILCGLTPIFPPETFLGPKLAACPGFYESNTSLGWQLHEFWSPNSTNSQPDALEWTEAPLTWTPHPDAPSLQPDIMYACRKWDEGWSFWRSIEYTFLCSDARMPEEFFGYVGHTKRLWDKACNLVQWRPGERSR